MADTDDVDDEIVEDPARIAQRKADRDGWVPFNRAQRMAENAARGEREAADKRIAEAEKHAAETTKPREYTRVELQGFVDAGQISQENANALWDQQLEKRVRRDVDQQIDTRLTTHNRAVAVQAQVDRYKEFLPDLGDKESETAQKVEREFRALVDLGQPEHVQQGGYATELLALRNIFGPVEALQKSRTGLQTHRESDARGDDDRDDDATKDGWPKGLSARQKAHYEDQIRKGIYKSKEDVARLHERVAKRRGARA